MNVLIKLFTEHVKHFNVLRCNFSYKTFIMNSVHINHHEPPVIKLEIADFKEHFSEKVEVKEDSVQTDQKIIDCKIEDGTDLGEMSSVSVSKPEREEKVRKFVIEFVVS